MPRLGIARQQEEKDRNANQCGKHANRKLLRRDDCARQRIGDDQQATASERRGRKQQALIIAGGEAHQMRNDQADETDSTGVRDGGSGG